MREGEDRQELLFPHLRQDDGEEHDSYHVMREKDAGLSCTRSGRFLVRGRNRARNHDSG